MSVLIAAPQGSAFGSPPKTPLQELAERSDPGELLGRRAFGACIDFIVLFLILLIPDGVLGNALYQQTLWVWISVQVLYFVLGEGLWGRSVGKLLMGIVVVDAAGRAPGIFRAVARTVLRIVEVNPLLLCLPAGIALIASTRRQRLGDMLARTYVVRAVDLKALKNGAPPPLRAATPVETAAADASALSLLVRRWIGAVIDLVVVMAMMIAPYCLADGRVSDPVLMLLMATPIAYFLVLETIWGRTLGKLVTGTIVVDRDGRPPGFARALIRTALRGLEVNPFLIGGLPAGIAVLASKRHQRLGDRLAGTYVVRKKDLGTRPNEAPAA